MHYRHLRVYVYVYTHIYIIHTFALTWHERMLTKLNNSCLEGIVDIYLLFSPLLFFQKIFQREHFALVL